MDAHDKNLEILNHLLVETFNEILKVEEQSLRLSAGAPVTVTELHVLDAIGNGEPRTISALAAAMRVTVSTMTIGINRLEKKGFVERVRESADRRVVRVKLTDRGRTLAYIHQRFHRRMARAVVDRLEPTELDILCRAMENLKSFFHEESERNAKGKEQSGLSETAGFGPDAFEGGGQADETV